jgi:hypothetical protein
MPGQLTEFTEGGRKSIFLFLAVFPGDLAGVNTGRGYRRGGVSECKSFLTLGWTHEPR